MFPILRHSPSNLHVLVSHKNMSVSRSSKPGGAKPRGDISEWSVSLFNLSAQTLTQTTFRVIRNERLPLFMAPFDLILYTLNRERTYAYIPVLTWQHDTSKKDPQEKEKKAYGTVCLCTTSLPPRHCPAEAKTGIWSDSGSVRDLKWLQQSIPKSNQRVAWAWDCRLSSGLLVYMNLILRKASQRLNRFLHFKERRS